jgi:lipopolysaccharide transport system permease protein
MKPTSLLPVRIYSAQSMGPTFLGSLAQAVRETWHTREILRTLIQRDLRLQYRQKLLGVAGAFVHPLLALFAFWLLHAAGVLRVGELALPYPIFLFAGTFLWGTFVLGLQKAASALVTQGDLLLRTSVPKITLVLAAFATVLPGLLLQWFFLTCLLVAFQIMPPWTYLLYPVLVLPLLILALGLGLFLAPLVVVMRELPGLMGTCLNFLLYLTPVIYHARLDHPLLRLLSTWNPLGYLIDGPRSWCLTGEILHLGGFLGAMALSFVMLLLGVRSFYLIQDRSAERL